jgi:hypothetical protein
VAIGLKKILLIILFGKYFFQLIRVRFFLRKLEICYLIHSLNSELEWSYPFFIN